MTTSFPWPQKGFLRLESAAVFEFRLFCSINSILYISTLELGMLGKNVKIVKMSHRSYRLCYSPSDSFPITESVYVPLDVDEGENLRSLPIM